MKYDWLLFDLDNTILDFDQAMVFGFNKTIADFDIPKNEEHFFIYDVINKRCWEDLEKGKITQDQLRTLRMERFLRHIGSTEDPFRFSEKYHENLSAKIFWMDGAKSLIEDWSEQFNLVLVTNGIKEIQRARLAKTDLRKHFQHIVISDEIGVAKPHRGFFDYVFEKIDFPKKEKVMIIGDSLSSDIRGGNNYGIDTCWINLKGKTAHAHNSPKFTIEKLEELKGIIL
ncbi:MAG: YjjG family noncanonical pyrimidine nucleotidase [Saprospiraceae bacterium]